MKIIEKDILTVEKGIICQQVNCQGVMGSGLAKSIRNKWPVVYAHYLYECKGDKDHPKTNPDFTLLGAHLFVAANQDISICNIFGQLNYGYDGKRYTDYSALNTAFFNIAQEKDQLGKLDIYFPFNFGCERGGADWKIVSKMIEYYFPDAIICKFPFP